MSMKNSNDTIGNRTRDLPACSAVSQSPSEKRLCSMELVTNVFCVGFPVSLEVSVTNLLTPMLNLCSLDGASL